MIKETLEIKCVEDFKLLESEPRTRKTIFYNNFFDQFSKFNIKRFHVCKGKNIGEYNFVYQEFDKVKILILIKKNKNECKTKKR